MAGISPGVSLSPLPSLGFTAHHQCAWGHSEGGQCSQQWYVQERNRVGERNGVEGGEKGAGSCFLSSQVTALSCSWKGELSLTPSLVCVGKKRSSNLRRVNQATAAEGASGNTHIPEA